MAGAGAEEDYLVTTTWGDEYKTEDQIIDYIVAANIQRRHLTAGQKAMLAADLEPMYAEAAKGRVGGRPKLGEEKPSANSREVSGREQRADEQAAKVTGSSGRSVSDAKALKKDAPDLAEKVHNGEMTLNAATKERQGRKQPKTPSPTPQPHPKHEEVINLTAQGATRQEIAETAGLAKRTVDRIQREERLVEALKNESMIVAWDTIPGNQREKLERVKASVRKELEKEFRTRLLVELDQHRAQLNADWIAHRTAYDEQNAKLNALRDEERRRYQMGIEVDRAKGLITLDDYNVIRSCLHPDSRMSVTNEKLAAAFRVFNDARIKILLVKEV